MKNITVGDKEHEDLRDFKLKLSLKQKREASYGDAVHELLNIARETND